VHYYKLQAGAGSRLEHGIGAVYERSLNEQSGRGCCGIGRVLTAAATPLITKGLKAVGQELSNAGLGLYSDMRRNPSLPLTRAAISRLAEAGENLKRRARKAFTGRGATTKKRSKKKVKKTAKKRTTSSVKKKIKRRATTSRSQKGRGAPRVKTPHQDAPPDIFS